MSFTRWVRSYFGECCEEWELSCFELLCEDTCQLGARIEKVAQGLLSDWNGHCADTCAATEALGSTALIMLCQDGLRGFAFLWASKTIVEEGESADLSGESDVTNLLAPLYCVGSVRDRSSLIAAMDDVRRAAEEVSRLIMAGASSWTMAKEIVARIAIVWEAALCIATVGLYLT
jgi:hypothetical protein